MGFWGYIRRARQHFTVRWVDENTAIMRSVVQPDALEAALEESLIFNCGVGRELTHLGNDA